MSKKYCWTDASRNYGYPKTTKAAARKAMAAEVRAELKDCRRRHKRCTQVGTVREGAVEIKIGGRQGYHTWNWFSLTDRCPR